jgi:hypothetical protein
MNEATIIPNSKQNLTNRNKRATSVNKRLGLATRYAILTMFPTLVWRVDLRLIAQWIRTHFTRKADGVSKRANNRRRWPAGLTLLQSMRHVIRPTCFASIIISLPAHQWRPLDLEAFLVCARASSVA